MAGNVHPQSNINTMLFGTDGLFGCACMKITLKMEKVLLFYTWYGSRIDGVSLCQAYSCGEAPKFRLV